MIELVVSNFAEQIELLQGFDINLVSEKGPERCIALFSDIYSWLKGSRFLLFLIYLLFIDTVIL
jgi:hypothetical protein